MEKNVKGCLYYAVITTLIPYFLISLHLVMLSSLADFIK